MLLLNCGETPSNPTPTDLNRDRIRASSVNLSLSPSFPHSRPPSDEPIYRFPPSNLNPALIGFPRPAPPYLHPTSERRSRESPSLPFVGQPQPTSDDGRTQQASSSSTPYGVPVPPSLNRLSINASRLPQASRGAASPVPQSGVLGRRGMYLRLLNAPPRHKVASTHNLSLRREFIDDAETTSPSSS